MVSVQAPASQALHSLSAESELGSNFQCVIKDTEGYQKADYDDIFVVELRDNKTAASHIRWKRKHPGASDYTELETVRGCHLAKWKSSTHNQQSIVDVTCANDGEDGSLILNTSKLEGELSFYNPQIGYAERALFWVECKRF